MATAATIWGATIAPAPSECMAGSAEDADVTQLEVENEGPAMNTIADGRAMNTNAVGLNTPPGTFTAVVRFF